MNKLLNTELTRHAQNDRAYRLEQIKANIGIGQIVKEMYCRSWDKVEAGQGGVYLCITDTGVTIIKDELKQKIITIYVTTFGELVKCYGGVKHIPTYLRKKVDRNQSAYIKNKKTVWR